MIMNHAGNLPLMAQEAHEASTVISQQLAHNADLYTQLSQTLQKRHIKHIFTLARGSSAHAAQFAGYLFNQQCALTTCALPLVVTSLYQPNLDLRGSLVLVISQSGQSKDLCASLTYAKHQGALTVALVNEIPSPLSDIAEFVIPMRAGPERAVAATKSVIASLTAVTHCAAIISQSDDLLVGLHELSPRCKQALSHVPQPHPAWQSTHHGLVIGRGYGSAIAHEAALKLTETATIHTQAYSSAEIWHGPLTLASKTCPFIAFAQDDVTRPQLISTLKKISATQNICVCFTADHLTQELSSITHCDPISFPSTSHPVCNSIIAMAMFYIYCAQLAILRGSDPDQPPLLNKVTSTR